MPIDIALDDLRWFGMIAGAGGLSAASRTHGIPKATLSRAVVRIEDLAGAPVFDRVSNGLRLTPLGETLMPMADEAMRVVRDVADALRATTGKPSGPLRVAASALASHQFVAPTVAALTHAYPDVRTELRVTSDPVDPIDEGFDVVVRIGLPRRENLIAKKIVSGNLKLYGTSDATIGVDLDSPEEVATLDRVVLSIRKLRRDWTLTCNGTNETVTLDRDPIVAVDDPTIALETMRHGRGIAFIPDLWGDRMVASGELVPILPRWSGPELTVFAVMAPRRASIGAVRAFLDELAVQARELKSGHARLGDQAPKAGRAMRMAA